MSDDDKGSHGLDWVVTCEECGNVYDRSHGRNCPVCDDIRASNVDGLLADGGVERYESEDAGACLSRAIATKDSEPRRALANAEAAVALLKQVVRDHEAEMQAPDRR